MHSAMLVKKKKKTDTDGLYVYACRYSHEPTQLVHAVYTPVWTPPSWPSGKASSCRVEDPGFESRLRRDFFGVESYQ